jgi:hypothetical protein
MQVGDLVRHIVHSGALGIIIDWNGATNEYRHWATWLEVVQ